MKEEFKNFVNNHKELIKYVNEDKMTWQKFYDMYVLYGKDNDVWDEYLKKDKNARNILIEHNLRLVVFLSKKYDNTRSRRYSKKYKYYKKGIRFI